WCAGWCRCWSRAAATTRRCSGGCTAPAWCAARFSARGCATNYMPHSSAHISSAGDMTTTPRSIYTIGGTVQAGRGVYIERAADAELLALCREGAFAYVLTARQMGKSSLMTETAARLTAEGIRPVQIDLTLIGTALSAEQWYLGLVMEV